MKDSAAPATAAYAHAPAIAGAQRAFRLYDHLSLRVLRLLAEVDQSGGLSRAAAQLNVVPSAASKRIKVLEDALGFAVLARNARGAALTPAGDVIARCARRILAEIDGLDGELSDLVRGVRGHVRLLASVAAIVHYLPEELAAFLAGYPDVKVDLLECTSEAIVHRLREGEADVGVFVADEPVPGLRCMPYRRERLMVVLPVAHPLAAEAALTFSDLLHEDWVAFQPGTALARLLAAQARAHGVVLKTRIEVYGMDSVCRMAQNGLGVGLLPVTPGWRAPIPGVALVALDEPWATRRVSIVVPADRAPSPAAHALVQMLAGQEWSD